MRLRYYYSKKGLSENRRVAKALLSKGPYNFTVPVYRLHPSSVEDLGTSLSVDDLTLAFEQLMILKLKPTLNVMLLVKGTPSVHSTSGG